MKKRTLTTPELIFIVGTRAVLAAGVALFVSSRLKDKTRRTAGLALMGIGGATTIPAAHIVLGKKSLFHKPGLAAKWLQ